MVNVMVGGTSDSSRADRSTFFYMRPEVWSVTPVELNAGTVSMLTISGTNFGADLAVEYAGRVWCQRYICSTRMHTVVNVSGPTCPYRG
jgi:hypothetical protein